MSLWGGMETLGGEWECLVPAVWGSNGGQVSELKEQEFGNISVGGAFKASLLIFCVHLLLKLLSNY